jgi:lipopolysaccharide transport system ATP-binding protein
MNDTLVDVCGLWKKYSRSRRAIIKHGVDDLFRTAFGRPLKQELRSDEFWALRDISFSVQRGEILGLCGHNGAGKTTLLKTLSGLLQPDRGSVSIRGSVGWLVDIGAGLNGNLTGRENVALRIDMLDLRRVRSSLFEYVETFTELGDFLDTPVAFYSSGMKAKLGFAIATMIKPDVLIVDETLAVGDLAFRMKCYSRISEISKDAAILFVSHGMNHVARICNRGLFLKQGTVRYLGGVQETINLYYDDMTDGVNVGGDGFNPDKVVMVPSVYPGSPFIGLMHESILVNVNLNMPSGEYFAALVVRDLSGNPVMESVAPSFIHSSENSIISVKVDSLDLAAGDYKMSIMLNDLHGNHLAVSNSVPLKVSGEHGSAVFYRPAAEVFQSVANHSQHIP